MPTRYVALRPDGKPTHLFAEDRKTRIRQVIWGDYLNVIEDTGAGWLAIDWAARSPNRRTLYIPAENTVATRPLEIIFVDVGQGDGAVLISPETGDEEQIMVIDAGEGGNMRAFLDGRFKTYRGFNFSAAVLTHADSDHYYGFKDIFADARIGFETIYHNGLVERPVSGTWTKLGGKPVKDAATGVSYLDGLAVDRASIEQLFSAADDTFQFPKTMRSALENPRIGDIRMLSTAHAQRENGVPWMPGFAPSNGRGYTIQVLGPVVEEAGGGQRLRQLGSYGETKNGHSVILKLRYGHFSVLFGGDLNEPAEKFLLQHYGRVDKFPKPGTPQYTTMMGNAGPVFRADVMKSCHHGSEKVTDAFLEAVNPAAFVISSGDGEGHIHPRPDLLGRLGLFGRGGAPIILSTELQRSSRPMEDKQVVEQLLADIDKLAAGTLGAARLDKLREGVKKLGRSNVEVYGAIYLKTDGTRLITAFQIETGSPVEKWFAFRYRFDEAGVLVRDE